MREVRLENEKYLTLLSKSCQLRRIAQLAYLSALIYSSLGMMLKRRTSISVSATPFNGEAPLISLTVPTSGFKGQGGSPANA